MSNTTISPPIPITNLSNAINSKKYVNQREINNVIGALCHDIAIILTNNYDIKTQSRKANDESFNLEVFTNTDQVELLITYFPTDFDYKINYCKDDQFKIEYDIYYRIEAKGNNKSVLEEMLGIIEQLICHNYNNGNYWSFIYNNKQFKSSLNSFNKLIKQNLQYQKVSENNYYLAKQTFKFSFEYNKI